MHYFEDLERSVHKQPLVTLSHILLTHSLIHSLSHSLTAHTLESSNGENLKQITHDALDFVGGSHARDAQRFEEWKHEQQRVVTV